MKRKNIIFEKEDVSVKIELSCVPFFRQGIGLMFSKRERANALLFNFGRNTNISLFSYFVYYPFIAIWLDEDDNVIDIRVVDPFLFGIRPSKKFRKVIEIPISQKYKEVCDFLLNSSNKSLKIKIR